MGRGGWGGAEGAGEAGEVAADVVADPLRRAQIQVDVAVLAPDEPGARCCLSVRPSGTKVMSLSHLERLRRARDLLAVKGTTRSRRD